jgi:metallo-beta-lactamase family protein
MPISLTFHGAASTVTGSCTLVATGTTKILVDCGMFQGSPEIASRNARLDFSPAELDAVILTHGHLDHAGRVPPTL